MAPLRGAPVWLVGGAVRDLLLGVDPVDLDLLVDCDPRELGSVSRQTPYLTATLTVAGHSYDVARARRETYPAPGALPVVAPASVDEDLWRRDFSVNAMALRLSDGEFLAVDGALDDLEARVLRVLHPDSFRDDPTRMLRLARYAARLDFSVADLDLISNDLLDSVSGVRIGNELRRLAAEADPVRGFVALRELGIDPGLVLEDEALARRALRLLEPADRVDRTVLACALLGRDPSVLERLGFVAADRDVIAAAALGAEKLAARLEMAGPPSEIDWVVGSASAEAVALAGAIHPANAAREWLAV
ncbi:MAG: CCA tRNA nucleotidyltransferase, partial [Solirubrobacterales bacterium]|nr:CCA tRNA nucleotidyltransferase [Solirubrobacterales bacterium]